MYRLLACILFMLAVSPVLRGQVFHGFGLKATDAAIRKAEKPDKPVTPVSTEIKPPPKQKTREDYIEAFKDVMERTTDERRRIVKDIKSTLKDIHPEVAGYLRARAKYFSQDFAGAIKSYTNTKEVPYPETAPEGANQWLLSHLTWLKEGQALIEYVQAIALDEFRLDAPSVEQVRRDFKKARDKKIEDALNYVDKMSKTMPYSETPAHQQNMLRRLAGLRQWLDRLEEAEVAAWEAYHKALAAPDDAGAVYDFVRTVQADEQARLNGTCIAEMHLHARLALLFLLQHHPEYARVKDGSVHKMLVLNYSETFDFAIADGLMAKALDAPGDSAYYRAISDAKAQLDQTAAKFRESFLKAR